MEPAVRDVGYGKTEVPCAPLQGGDGRKQVAVLAPTTCWRSSTEDAPAGSPRFRPDRHVSRFRSKAEQKARSISWPTQVDIIVGTHRCSRRMSDSRLGLLVVDESSGSASRKER